jgi:HK97 family phage major capsid protein
MSAKLRALQAKKAEQVQAARAFNDATDAKATAENRGWTDEETAAYAALRDGIGATSAAIERENALIAEEAGIAAARPAGASSVAIPAAARIEVRENVENDPKRGFKSFGEFAQAVYGASQVKAVGGAADTRLAVVAAAPTTYGNEGAGADGGFAIPPAFSPEIFQLSLGEDALLPLCDDVNVTGNNMTFPKDETTPWGSNGIRAYWQGEAAAGTQVKPVLGTMALRLKKLMALVPMTDELLADTSALDSWLPGKVADSIRWKTNEAILFGTGGGLPLGALNSGAAVVVSKDSGQSSNTLTATNLANMIARLPSGSFGKAVWVINNDVLPALFTLTLGNYPIYLPGGMSVNGAIQSNPYGMLLGRPIIVSQHAKSFSSQGDVNLVDLSYYQAITKAGGVETATSMHIYFDADAVAFRTVFRMDGQSKLSAAITPANGSNNLSPFLSLQAR